MKDDAQILFIDDEPINLQLFEIVFGSKYPTSLALSGKTGLEMLASSTSIRVVLCDMKMPVMNGLEFTSRAKELYPDLHIYILTGYLISQEMREAIKDGLIEGYLNKPFEREEIEKALDGVLAL